MSFTDTDAQNLMCFVKDCAVFQGHQAGVRTRLPFFADGHPGIIYLQTPNPARIYPHDKPLSSLFLYGQTLEPIEIELNGEYQMILFRLFPFAIRSLFHIDPGVLNDECYDLVRHREDARRQLDRLQRSATRSEQLELMADFVAAIARRSLVTSTDKIQQAVSLIVNLRGQISVKSLTEQLNVTERTLQRLFAQHVGVSPKQFAKIIQFQHSLEHLSQNASALTDIGYDAGYADQSHFIRSFRRYAGKKPSDMRKLQ